MKKTHKARSGAISLDPALPPSRGHPPLPTPLRRAGGAVRKPQGYRHESGKPSNPMAGLSECSTHAALRVLQP